MGSPREAGGGLPLEAGPCEFNLHFAHTIQHLPIVKVTNPRIMKHNVIKLVGHFYSNYTL